MRDLLDTLSFAVSIAFIAALIFIFKGEPSLVDKWHAEAMGKCISPPPSSQKLDGGQKE